MLGLVWTAILFNTSISLFAFAIGVSLALNNPQEDMRTIRLFKRIVSACYWGGMVAFAVNCASAFVYIYETLRAFVR